MSGCTIRDDASDLDLQAPARRRLAYDEFLAGQISLALVRQRLRKAAVFLFMQRANSRREFAKAMPFSLTGSQEAAVQAVLEDMSGDQRMLRLLQGDVGSGKTAVALMAMAAAVEVAGRPS